MPRRHAITARLCAGSMPGAHARATLAAVALCTLALAAPPGSVAAPGMLVGIEQNGGMDDATLRTQSLHRMDALGAQVIRLQLRFDRIATCDPKRTAVSPSSPANPCYHFATVDAVVREASALGMTTILSVMGVPRWEFGDRYSYTGTTSAQFERFVADYANFAAAASTRYDGAHGHPRVLRWTIWNEPNGGYFWAPRSVSGKLVAPARYVRLYDVAARRIKRSDPGLLVAPGPLAPSATLKPGTFLKLALPVLQRKGSPVDAFAMNAYTRGRQPLSAIQRFPSIGLGNLDDLTALLDRYRVTAGKPIWITEFAFETAPDPRGLSLAQQSAGLSEAVYVAWRDPRVSVFIWYGLFDDRFGSDPGAGFQSGLYRSILACAQRWCAKDSASMFAHPLWVSTTAVAAGWPITVWASSRTAPATARVWAWIGGGWQYFDLRPSADGAIYFSWRPTADTWLVACDAQACGPARLVQVVK